jgi:hypothetical protein
VSWGYVWASEPPYTQQADVEPHIEVICAYVLVADVVEGVSMGSEGWAFTLEFKDDEAVVMFFKVKSVK